MRIIENETESPIGVFNGYFPIKQHQYILDFNITFQKSLFIKVTRLFLF